MCNCEELTLTAGQVESATPIILISGDAQIFYVDVFQQAMSAFGDGSDCGGDCDGTENIVIPPTVTITDSSVEIYAASDLVIPVFVGVPTETDILAADNTTIVGYRLSYLVDTDALPVEIDQRYILPFKYTLSDGQRFTRIFYFNVVPVGFLPEGC